MLYRDANSPSSDHLEAEAEYYRLKADELQLMLELEQHNRTLDEARRRKTLEREDADLIEKTMEGYRATVQYLFKVILKTQSELNVLKEKLKNEQDHREGNSAGVTGREAEQVIDMLTLERQRKQKEMDRLEKDLAEVRGTLAEAEHQNLDMQTTLNAYEELLTEKDKETEELVKTMEDVVKRARVAADSAELWRRRALEIATEAADKSASESGKVTVQREYPGEVFDVGDASHCIVEERLMMENLMDKMSITTRQKGALTCLKVYAFMRRALRKAILGSLLLARWLCETGQSSSEASAAHLCLLLTQAADGSAAAIRMLAAVEDIHKCVDIACAKGAADLMLSSEMELDEVVQQVSLYIIDLSALPFDDLLQRLQGFLIKLQSAYAAMFPDLNFSSTAGSAGSAVLVARLASIGAQARDVDGGALVRACTPRLSKGPCGARLPRAVKVEGDAQAAIRVLEKTTLSRKSDGGDRTSRWDVKEISQGLEAAAFLIGQLQAEGELPEVTPCEIDAVTLLDNGIVQLVQDESARYNALLDKAEMSHKDAEELRAELQASRAEVEALREAETALGQRLMETTHKDEVFKAQEAELDRLRAEMDYYRRVERRQLRAQLSSTQKELDNAGSKEASLRRKVERFEQAERLRDDRERATGSYGGDAHLLVLQMKSVSQQNARLRARLARALIRDPLESPDSLARCRLIEYHRRLFGVIK